MRVLMTGIGGSIGVHVFEHIMLNTEWEVVGLDSYRHKGYFDRVAQTLQRSSRWNKRLHSITHDLTTPLTPGQIARMGQIDYIINLASLSDVWDSVADPLPFCRNNHELMLNMLELARALKPKAFLHFSTDEVYGPAAVNQGHPEWATPVPSNPYAASKAAQEMLAIAWWRSYNVPVIITNTMNNFGQMQAASKYPVIIQKKLEKGEPIEVHTTSDGEIGTRYYIHSRNVADAVLFILQTTTPYLHQPGEVDKPDRYNIVGTQQDNLELAETIARLMAKPIATKLVDFHSNQPGHDVHYGLDGSKLAELGWNPPVSFEDSLASTIAWQQANPEWIK